LLKNAVFNKNNFKINSTKKSKEKNKKGLWSLLDKVKNSSKTIAFVMVSSKLIDIILFASDSFGIRSIIKEL